MPRRYENLNKIIADINPKIIVEIGTFNGNQAINMMTEALRFHAVEKLKYIGFDLFERPPEYEGSKPGTLPFNAVVAKLHRAFPRLRFNLIKGDTRESIANFLGVNVGERIDIKADFVFIDGGHSLDTIWNDFDLVRRYMCKSGTVIVLDDYYFDRDDKGCKPLIVEIIDDDKIKIEILNPIDKFDKPDGVLSVQFVKVTIL